MFSFSDGDPTVPVIVIDGKLKQIGWEGRAERYTKPAVRRLKDGGRGLGARGRCMEFKL